MAGSNATGPRLCSSEAGQGQRVCTTRTGPSITRLSSVARGSLWLQPKPNAFRALQSEGRDLFKEHLVLFREGFSSFFSSSELSATDVFSSSSFSSLFISLVPEETLLRPSPPDKPAKEHKRLEGAGSLHSCGIIPPSHPSRGGGLQFCCSPFTPISPLTTSRARVHPSPSSAVPGVSLYPQPEGQKHA